MHGVHVRPDGVADAKHRHVVVVGPSPVNEQPRRLVDDHHGGVREQKLDLVHAPDCLTENGRYDNPEGLPLRHIDYPAYLRWAVDAFRLATAGVRDQTQIHTHMCYSEFGDILEVKAALSNMVEAARRARAGRQSSSTEGA